MLVLTAGLLVGCGDKEGAGERSREGMPLYRVKLRNVGPPDGPPAQATVEGESGGQPGGTLTAGPVPPGAQAASQPPGTEHADSIRVTVNLGPTTLHGVGSYPGASIEMVDIEADEAGGMATVTFHMGQPTQSIPLAR
jgi:hypothetical protein